MIYIRGKSEPLMLEWMTLTDYGVGLNIVKPHWTDYTAGDFEPCNIPLSASSALTWANRYAGESGRIEINADQLVYYVVKSRTVLRYLGVIED